MKSYVIGYVVLGVVAVLAVVLANWLGRRAGRRSLQQRLTALSNRLGVEPPDEGGMEPVLSHLERVSGEAAEAVTEASSDAIRLRRALDTLPQGVIVCDENGDVAFRNARAVGLMNNRHGDALAAQAVTELLENAWQDGSAERTLDLYGPPRQTLTVRTRLVDDGRRPLGVIAIIEDVSERRRLEEIRRDFVANVSHELKTPMGALGLLAETLTVEPDPTVAQRLASRIHTEAFRVSRIIDDLFEQRGQRCADPLVAAKLSRSGTTSDQDRHHVVAGNGKVAQRQRRLFFQHLGDARFEALVLFRAFGQAAADDVGVP